MLMPMSCMITWTTTASALRLMSEPRSGYRVRAAQVEKVPYLIILGKNEVKRQNGQLPTSRRAEYNNRWNGRVPFHAEEEIRTKKIKSGSSKIKIRS